MTQNIQSISWKLPEVSWFFEGINMQEEDVIIAISWWSDSMLAATLIYKRRSEKKWDINKLHFIYCDHRIREHKDIECIQTYISPVKLHIVQRKNTEKNTENDLRKRRYKQINKYAEKIWSQTMVTGHHLSDRIESTFLHLLRGCDIDGFMSMSKEDKNHGHFNGKIIRPLLHIGKRKVVDICTKYNIPYIQDYTNNDTNISKRNKLRHDILWPLLDLANKNTKNENTFEESMLQVYRSLEKDQKKSDIKLEAIALAKHRNAPRWYRWIIKKEDIGPTEVKQVMSILKINNNATKKNIVDISNFLREKASGHKYINKTYFFISHGNIYIIQWPKTFRKNEIIKIPDEYYELFTNIDSTKKSLKKRHLATKEDKIHGKKRNKRCINHKIPLFWRKCIPLVTDKDNHIKPYIPDFIKK